MKKTTIKKVLTRQIAVFVSAMMVLILCTIAVMMTNTLKRELRRSLAVDTFHIEEMLENYLLFQKENITSLSINHFITNSLVDISGRDLYLPKLINGFLEARQIADVTVVDFEGKVIHSSMDLPPDYLLTTRLRSALEAGRSLLELSPRRRRIIFIEPILFYQTPQGAVIVEIDLGAFAAQAISQRKDFYFSLLRQGKAILELQDRQGDFLIVSHAFSPHSKYLQQLGLSLKIGTLKSSYLDLVKKVIAPLSLLAIIFITLSVLLAAKIANALATPILKLCERVQSEDIFADKIHGPLKTNNELEQLAEAFDQRNMRLREEMEERRRAEKQNALSFERFKTVLNSIDALVYVADMETYEVLFINQYGQNIWGEITGKICWRQLQNKQSGPCPFCTNHKLIDADGKPTGVLIWEFQNTVDQKWYQCRDQVIKWTDGRYVRMEIAVDITRQKETEEALAEEKERLAVTLRSIGDGVITTDTDGEIVLLNTVAEQLTGWSQEEAFGRQLTGVFDIINEKTRQPCENPVEKVMASGQIIGLANHTALIAKDGTELSIADSGAPIRDKEGQIVGVVLVFRDVTENLRMEEQLIKAKKLESVGILAGGIAHDFNNILTAILGNINLVRADNKLTTRTQDLLAEAEKASIRAKDLTQQLLTFSKGGEPVKKTAAIVDIIRDSSNFILHGSNVACRFDIPQDLWFAVVDSGQISQVIQNIVLNAKQAMPMAGVIEISFENVESLPKSTCLPSNENYIKICIKDTGIGIQEELLEKIFDPYFTTKQEGSGLGLAVTHSIINRHNGHISVQSKVGEGTTFTIFLPAVTSIQEPEEIKDDNDPRTRSMRVLVMDDDEQIRELTKAMLSRIGHQTVLAKDAEEAINTYEEYQSAGNPIDIVIMDLTIPGGMGGKEAVQEILKRNPEAKVIVSSGYSNDPIMANYMDYGFCAAIVKPYVLEDLSGGINDFACQPNSCITKENHEK